MPIHAQSNVQRARWMFYDDGFVLLTFYPAKPLGDSAMHDRARGNADSRGSHFYFALYWAEALAAQDDDAELKAHFGPTAAALREYETIIMEEMNAAQGVAVDLGGYYLPDPEKLVAAMRPSATFNELSG